MFVFVAVVLTVGFTATDYFVDEGSVNATVCIGVFSGTVETLTELQIEFESGGIQGSAEGISYMLAQG